MSYLPQVAWSSWIKDVAIIDATNYSISLTADNQNEPGATLEKCEIGYYIRDNIGNTYKIVEILTTTPLSIKVFDELSAGVGPQQDRLGYVYKPVGDGDGLFIAPIPYNRLSPTAIETARPIELDVLWKHRGISWGENVNITGIEFSGISGTITSNGGWQGGNLLTLNGLHNSLTDLNSGNGQFYHWTGYSNSQPISTSHGVVILNEDIWQARLSDSRMGDAWLNLGFDSTQVDETNTYGVSVIESWADPGSEGWYLALNPLGGNVAINKYKALFPLDVNGIVNVTGFKMVTGAVNGYYLRTDGDGVASWASVTSSQVYKGVWNATTNTPTLSNGSGTSGWWYRCTVGGTVDFGAGNITFSSGDDVMYDGTIWSKIPGVTYTLVTATDSILGGVKIGNTIGIASGVINVLYGTTNATACVGNDSRLSDARVASDVYTWAKQATKPSYTYSEVGAQGLHVNLTSLAALSYSSSSLVRMSAAGTFTLDTSQYLVNNQSISLSGDISGTGSTSISTTIGANKVTLAMMATMATSSFLGRNTALTGNVEVLSATTVKSMLGLGTAAYTNSTAYASALHVHGNILNTGYLGVTANIPLITGVSGIIQAGSFGTTANTFCQGNDVRLSDNRTAIAHNLLSAIHGDTLTGTVVRGDIIYGNSTPKWARLAFPTTPTGKILQATATDIAWSTYPLTIGVNASISGSNTGDQTSIVGISGTKAQFNTAVSDGDFMWVGDAPTAHTHPYLLLTGGTMSNTTVVSNLNADLLDGYNASQLELALGNPSINGYVLASTTAGVRSWVVNNYYEPDELLKYPATGTVVAGAGSGVNGPDNEFSTVLGVDCGAGITTGTRNILIGYGASYYRGNISNKLFIGNQIGSDTPGLIEGDLSTGFVTIQTRLTIGNSTYNYPRESAFIGTDAGDTVGKYFTLPNGYIMQFGRYSSDSDAIITVTFPIAFPTACVSVVTTEKMSSGVITKYNTHFTIDRDNTVDTTQWREWIAIGY